MFLEFYVFGERVIGWVGGGGTKHFISFEGGIKYFPTVWGCVPNFMVKFWNTLHTHPPVHILHDRSLVLFPRVHQRVRRPTPKSSHSTVLPMIKSLKSTSLQKMEQIVG